MVFAMGKPIAGVRDPREFKARLDRTKAVATAVTSEEAELLTSKFGVSVEPVEEVRGLNVARGSKYAIHIAIVRPGPAGARPAESTARAGGGEQALVK